MLFDFESLYQCFTIGLNWRFTSNGSISRFWSILMYFIFFYTNIIISFRWSYRTLVYDTYAYNYNILVAKKIISRLFSHSELFFRSYSEYKILC